MTAARDLEPLLAHVSWVRTLALQLCADVHAAEDAAQDTWAMALRHGLRHPNGARSFLARTLRNALAMSRRSDRRRVRREKLAALSADSTDVDASELVARADLHRQLVIAVLALPELQRGLVLRHYFEGQDIATLAAKMRTSSDAVRAHLRRARDRLRDELERGSEGARAFALLVAASKPVASAATAGVMVLMKLKIVLAAAAALAAVWLLVPMAGSESGAADVGSADAAMQLAAPAADRVTTSATPELGAPMRTEVTPVTELLLELRGTLVGLRPDVPWTAPLAMRVMGVTVDRLPAPAGWKPSAAGMFWGRSNPLEHPDRVPVSADGAFTITLPAWARHCQEFELRFEAREPFYLPLNVKFGPEVRGQDGPLVVQVDPVSVLAGRVVDSRGNAVPAARVCVFLPFADRNMGECHGRGSTATGADGSYRLQVPLAATLLVLAVPMQDESRHRDDLLPASTRVQTQWGVVSEVSDMVLAEPAVVTGSVTDRDGSPLAGVAVAWVTKDSELSLYQRGLGNLMNWPDGSAGRITNARTDRDGRFRLPAVPGKPGICVVSDAEGRLEPFVEMAKVTPPAEVAFRLAGGIAVVRVCRDGAPVPGVAVAVDTIGEQLTSWNDARRTDARGEVRFLRSQRSGQQLIIRPDCGAEQTVELPADASADAPLVVDLPAMETVPVRLVCDARQFELTCKPLDAARVPVRRSLQGESSAVALPAGRYQFQVSASERATNEEAFLLPWKQDVEVPLPGGALQVPIAHGGRVRVTVTDAVGSYVGGAVTLTGPGGRFHWWLSGRYVADSENVPAGSYEWKIDVRGQPAHQGAITVKACEVTEVRVRLP